MYDLHFIPEEVAQAYVIFKTPKFYRNKLAMKITADVKGSKPNLQ
jgi:hypothetical protein